MLIDMIKEMKAKLKEQGHEPLYIWCNSLTERKIFEDLKDSGLIKVSKKYPNPKVVSVDNLMIKINEDVPPGAIIISGDEYQPDIDVPKLYTSSSKLN